MSDIPKLNPPSWAYCPEGPASHRQSILLKRGDEPRVAAWYSDETLKAIFASSGIRLLGFRLNLVVVTVRCVSKSQARPVDVIRLLNVGRGNDVVPSRGGTRECSAQFKRRYPC